MGVHKKKKGSRLGVVALGAFALFCSVKIIGLQMEISQKEYQLQDLEQQIEEQEKRNDDISSRISSNAEDSDTNAARVAFDQYGYGYPDEHVYKDNSVS